MFMTYILTNFFSKNKTFYFFQPVDIFFISAQQMFKCTLMKEQINLLKSNQHMSSHRNFGTKQIFWADDYSPYALNNRWPRPILIWWALHKCVLWQDLQRGESGTSCTHSEDFKKLCLKNHNKRNTPPYFLTTQSIPCIGYELYWKRLCCAIIGWAGGWINQWIGFVQCTMLKRSVKTFAQTLNKIFIFFNFY
jgi:hypothetical protein